MGCHILKYFPRRQGCGQAAPQINMSYGFSTDNPPRFHLLLLLPFSLVLFCSTLDGARILNPSPHAPFFSWNLFNSKCSVFQILSTSSL